MKKLFFASIVLAFTTFIYSCTSTKVSQGNTINATIKTGQTYTYILGQYGIEEGAVIDKQASHFSISEIKRMSTDMQYTYQSAPGYTGNDKVVIKSNKGGIGDGTGGTITYTTINLTVVP